MATLIYLQAKLALLAMSFAFAQKSKTNKNGDGSTFTFAKYTTSMAPHAHITNSLNKTSDYIIQLQRTIGNQAVQRLLRSKDNNDAKGFDFAKFGIIQPKLKISKPEDEYEEEADKVADQVMRMIEPSYSVIMSQAAATDGESVDRKCAACEMKNKEDDKKLQISRKPSTTYTSNVEAKNETANEINDIRFAGGSSIDSNTREFMESGFGDYDFSNVRIHTDERAAQSANSFNALAYTVGNDIVFGEGRYAPNTVEGKRLLAHELTHIIQQSFVNGSSKGTANRKLSSKQIMAVEYSLSKMDFHKAPLTVQRVPDSPGSSDGDCIEATTGPPPPIETVSFPNNVSELSSLERMRVDNFVKNWNADGTRSKVRIDGFASTRGKTNDNLVLSCNRVKKVEAELQKPSDLTPGIPGSLIESFAQGETDEFGSETDNRIVTIFSPLAKPPTPTPTPTPTTDVDLCDPQKPCARNPNCPEEFCTPFPTRKEAIESRDVNRSGIVSAINMLNGNAGPLFEEYLNGGTSTVKDLSVYAEDFTNDYATIKAAEFLREALKKKAPSEDGTKTVNIEEEIPDAIAELNNPESPNKLEYVGIGLPGLIAGGIGRNQASCKVGANPSDQNDERLVQGTATIHKTGSDIVVDLDEVVFIVKDTIDFCPGNCGGFLAQLFETVLMSRYEACGISGDVPFIVRFASPLLIGAYGSEE